MCLLLLLLLLYCGTGTSFTLMMTMPGHEILPPHRIVHSAHATSHDPSHPPDNVLDERDGGSITRPGLSMPACLRSPMKKRCRSCHAKRLF